MRLRNVYGTETQCMFNYIETLWKRCGLRLTNAWWTELKLHTGTHFSTSYWSSEFIVSNCLSSWLQYLKSINKRIQFPSVSFDMNWFGVHRTDCTKSLMGDFSLWSFCIELLLRRNKMSALLLLTAIWVKFVRWSWKTRYNHSVSNRVSTYCFWAKCRDTSLRGDTIKLQLSEPWCRSKLFVWIISSP